MIVVGIRHFGFEAVEHAARFAARCGHPLVTGFGMAGEERFGDLEDYARLRDRPRGRPRHHRTCRRAGRLGKRRGRARPHPAGADRPRRVRAEKPDSVRRIAEEGVVLECCPGSNIALKLFDGFDSHPFPTPRSRRLQGDAQLRRPTLFPHQPEAEYDAVPPPISAWRTRPCRGDAHGDRSGLVDRKTKALLARLGNGR